MDSRVSTHLVRMEQNSFWGLSQRTLKEFYPCQDRAPPPSFCYVALSGLGSFRFTSFWGLSPRILKRANACVPCPTSVFGLLSSDSCLPPPVRASERLSVRTSERPNIRTSECPISASPFLLKLIPPHFCLNQKQYHSKPFCTIVFSISCSLPC